MGHRSHARAGQDRRRRRVAPGFGQTRDRPARRHGRAAGPRAEYVRACVAAREQDARVRPRRPYRDAARRGAVSVEASRFRRHRRVHLPAGGRGRRRREGDDRRRTFQTLSRRCRVRAAQLAGHAGGRIWRARRRDAGIEQRVRDPHQGCGRARGDSARRRRSGLHGDADRHGPAEHPDAQQAPDRCRRAFRSRRSRRATRRT